MIITSQIDAVANASYTFFPERNEFGGNRAGWLAGLWFLEWRCSTIQNGIGVLLNEVQRIGDFGKSILCGIGCIVRESKPNTSLVCKWEIIMKLSMDRLGDLQLNAWNAKERQSDVFNFVKRIGYGVHVDSVGVRPSNSFSEAKSHISLKKFWAKGCGIALCCAH